MVSLEFHLAMFGGSTAGKLAFQFGGKVAQIYILVKSRNFRRQSSPLSPRNSHSNPCLFLCDGFTDTQVLRQSAIRTNSAFVNTHVALYSLLWTLHLVPREDVFVTPYKSYELCQNPSLGTVKAVHCFMDIKLSVQKRHWI